MPVGGADARPDSLLLSRARLLLRRPLVHHAFELHAVGVGEIDRVVGGLVVLAGRVDHGHAALGEEGAEIVHVPAARKLEGVVVEADVALAVLVLLAFRIGGGDPEQRLAVAPARHVGIFVLELEAEETKQLVVEFLRAGEIADAEHQVIDADDAGHGSLHRCPGLYSAQATSSGVVPAKAGTHRATNSVLWNMGPRLRGDDSRIVAPMTAFAGTTA